jgi:hypothetical protein
MDPSRFDALVRAFAAALSRRRALGGLAAALAALPGLAADAKKKKKRHGTPKTRGPGHAQRGGKKKRKKCKAKGDGAARSAGQACCAGACVTSAWANLTTFGGYGYGPSQFIFPTGVAVAPDGQTAWVADLTNHRVSVWALGRPAP